MKKSKKIVDIIEVFGILENTNNYFFNKYVVDYKIEGDNVKVISNTGKYRSVKNTKSNLSKINHKIIKNKIEIAKKIDEYENSSYERLIVLLVNILLVVSCGILIPLSFFTGIYAFFLLSTLSFSISVITTLSSGFDYYILVKEIQSLKKITGYKKENEFKLPIINVKYIKSR